MVFAEKPNAFADEPQVSIEKESVAQSVEQRTFNP
jgi:hypothetical protein